MPRLRDLGITIGELAPGPMNAITDVEGVRVGHTTLIGDMPGAAAIRTGVTVVVPLAGDPFEEALYAGVHRLNGNGELTGLEWIRESGLLTTPVALTNTHSVGVVRDALVSAEIRQRGAAATFWSLPVVGETWDGLLNDIQGQHVGVEHLLAALDSAAPGPVAEGNVGGGTGMICHEFKGGIGTASRRLHDRDGGYTVGVLVQANHGSRERLAIDGVPVGRSIGVHEVPSPYRGEAHVPPGSGSIIGVVATDAPLLPRGCERLAQRAALGVARAGGSGAHTSGDLFLCFSTGNRGLSPGELDEEPPRTREVSVLHDAYISELFWATIEATEEAIANALVAAETMTGRDGRTAHAIPHERLLEVWRAARGTSA
jgi:D-aminopeptidase